MSTTAPDVVRIEIARDDLFALALVADFFSQQQEKAARDDFPADESPAMHETCLAASRRMAALAKAIRRITD